MFQFRAISNSAVRYASKLHAIKKFPVTLHISFPPYDEPTLVNFTSFEQITEFLEPKNILRHPTTGHALRATEVKKIDPGIVYDVIDMDFPFCGKRVQVGDRFFEGKSSLALWSVLKEEDPGVLRLPSVIRDKKRDVAEWEAIFQLSDGCIVFLEAKYRMSKVHVNKQEKQMSKSLCAMGCVGCAKLFLAAYYWQDDEDCLSYTRSQGYGIIQPNSLDLVVDVMAEDE